MMNVTYLITALKILVLCLWVPAVAWSAQVTLDETLKGLTALSVTVVMVLSTLSGATALLIRIDKEMRRKPEQELPRPTLFVMAHMLGSWTAGVLAFIISESQNANDWVELGGIVVASFLGAKFVELIAERWLPKVFPESVRAPLQ